MRFHFLLISLALGVQGFLVWTLGFRVNWTPSGDLALKPPAVIQSPIAAVPATVDPPKPAQETDVLAMFLPEISIQKHFDPANADHQKIEAAIRSKIEYDTGTKPEGDLTDRMVASIKYLDLSRLNLKDLGPLKVLAGLKELDLPHNQVTDLSPLEGHQQLFALYLKKNRGLTLEEINRLQVRLPNCVMVHDFE